MPKRTDLKKILIIGAGPIVIGQACEFDYSGAQACKSLMNEGYEIILINSNPATIMTDPDLANKTYIEPITKEFIEECNEHNLFVGSWGFSNIKQVIEVVSLGVQAVTVNWPLEVHRLLKKTFDWHRDF